jgi:hypothetical protein
MPDQIIHIPGLGNIAFSDTMSDQDITAAAKRLHEGGALPRQGDLRPVSRSITDFIPDDGPLGVVKEFMVPASRAASLTARASGVPGVLARAGAQGVAGGAVAAQPSVAVSFSCRRTPSAHGTPPVPVAPAHRASIPDDPQRAAADSLLLLDAEQAISADAPERFRHELRLELHRRIVLSRVTG